MTSLSGTGQSVRGMSEVLSLPPRLRGTLHLSAFPLALIGGLVLVLAADGTREQLGMSIYAGSLAGLLGVSALYHRGRWSPLARRWIRRLDHTMILVLIAGTTTPFALLVMTGATQTVVLCLMWGGVVIGAVLNLIWTSAPNWATAATAIGLGWVGLVGMPQIAGQLGVSGLGLIALGGLAYTAGGVIYARQDPDPWPGTFGFHEIFHALTLVAAGCHFAAVAGWALS